MLVSALLKSSETVRANCNAQSSFCLRIKPLMSETLFSGGDGAALSFSITGSVSGSCVSGADGAIFRGEAFNGVGGGGGMDVGVCAAATDAGNSASAAVGVGILARTNCRTNHLRLSLLNVEIEVVKFIAAPLAEQNFSMTTGSGVCSHRLKNSSAGVPFSADQMVDTFAGLAEIAGPNVAAAAALARRTMPRSSTNKAGHAAFSRPNAICEFIDFQTSQTKIISKKFKGRPKKRKAGAWEH